jgi:xanthine dehydrogenase FAD-binding subunit
MKNLCQEYLLTHSVEEALHILSTAKGPAWLIGGGSDLLLEIRQGEHPAVHTLVDVSEIGEMCQLEIRGETLFIGASVTLTRLANSTLVAEHARALAQAASLMGNPQVCNVATIGGNVAHALPAADGAIALLSLDAQAEIASAEGRRKVALQTLFKAPRHSTLDPSDELLVGFYLQLQKRGQASAFVRRTNPQGIPLAILNLSVWLQRTRDRITDIRIAVGPAGPVPMRMKAAENAFIDRVPSDDNLARGLDELLQEAHFRTSPHRATAEYRRYLAGILLQEAVGQAWLGAETR